MKDFCQATEFKWLVTCLVLVGCTARCYLLSALIVMDIYSDSNSNLEGMVGNQYNQKRIHG